MNIIWLSIICSIIINIHCYCSDSYSQSQFHETMQTLYKNIHQELLQDLTQEHQKLDAFDIERLYRMNQRNKHFNDFHQVYCHCTQCQITILKFYNDYHQHK